jgi:hypothetical protein
MYHQRGWKDVTKFTDSCDPTHEHSVHLLADEGMIDVANAGPSREPSRPFGLPPPCLETLPGTNELRCASRRL